MNTESRAASPRSVESPACLALDRQPMPGPSCSGNHPSPTGLDPHAGGEPVGAPAAHHAARSSAVPRHYLIPDWRLSKRRPALQR